MDSSNLKQPPLQEPQHIMVQTSRVAIGVATIIFFSVVLVYVTLSDDSGLAAMTGMPLGVFTINGRSKNTSTSEEFHKTAGNATSDTDQLMPVQSEDLEKQCTALNKQAKELADMRLRLNNMTELSKLWEKERASTVQSLKESQKKLTVSERARGELEANMAALVEQGKSKDRRIKSLLKELESCHTASNQSTQETQAKLDEMNDRVKAVQEEEEVLKKEKEAAEQRAVGAGSHWSARLGQGRFNLSAPHPISAGDPKDWRQRSFTPHGFYGFIQYSAYRVEPHAFRVAAIMHVQSTQGDIRRDLGRCTWHGRNGRTIPGYMLIDYDEHSSGARYTGAVLRCILSTASGDGGGFLLGELNQEEMILFREEPGQPQGTSTTWEFNLAYCSPPMHGPQDASAVRQWFDFHRVYAGAQHFTLYNVDAMDDNLREALKPYLDAGTVDVVELETMMAFDFFYYGQMLAIYDCMFSMALRSRWVFFLDLDEYLEAIPPHTVHGLLAAHEDQAWLSHGSLWWNVSMCIDRSGENDAAEQFAVERMVFRAPHIHCFQMAQPPTHPRELCRTWQGHRKLIVYPRKMTMVQVHNVVIWDGKGIDLDAGTDMRHNHFRKLNVKDGGNKCATLFRDEDVQEGTFMGGDEWQRDNRIAKLIPAVRANPLQG